jgi:integrase
MLYKRSSSKKWWVRFTGPDGSEIRHSTGTENRRQAQEYEDKLKASLWRQSRLKEQPRHTWQDAVLKWAEECTHKRTLDEDIGIFRRLDSHLGQRYLDGIDKVLLDDIIRSMNEKGLSAGRINRVMSLVRAVLRKAEREWSWLERAPSIRRISERSRRIRWITRKEAESLLVELPDHLAAMARFSLATGLREANVTGLEWSQIDLNRGVCWIHPDQAKAKKAIGIPLNRDAVAILREQIGRHPDRVFTYHGSPICKAGTRAWKRALDRAGIVNFRWHDLRHTWASWHVQSGTPLNVLQELGGWSCYSMVLRYAHLAPEHLAEHADRICNLEKFRTESGTHG